MFLQKLKVSLDKHFVKCIKYVRAYVCIYIYKYTSIYVCVYVWRERELRLRIPLEFVKIILFTSDLFEPGLCFELTQCISLPPLHVSSLWCMYNHILSTGNILRCLYIFPSQIRFKTATSLASCLVNICHVSISIWNLISIR